MKTLRKSDGLTIVEVIVAIAVATAMTIGIIALFGNFFSNSAAVTESALRTNALQSAVSLLQSDVAIAKNFERSANQDGYQGWYGDGNITGASTNKRSIVLRLPATTASYQDSSRQAIYVNPTDPTSSTCTSDQSREMVFVLVQYYIENETLYRRIITPNPLPTTCDNAVIFQRQTSSSPPDRDVVVSRHISELQVEYYADGGVTTTDTDAYNGDTSPLTATTAARLTVVSNYNNNGTSESVRHTAILAKGGK
mgnify:CR=1 FL=1